MDKNIVFGIELKGSPQGLVGAVKISREELLGLARDARTAGSTLDQEMQRGARGSDGLAASIARVGHYTAGYLGFQKFKEAAGAILEAQAAADKLRNSLAFATGSQGGAARDIAYLRQVTNALGLEFNSAASAYAKLAASAQGTSVSSRQVKDIFEAVAKASTVMGLSAEDTSGALLAISQMMSKGTVSAEELRGQLGERVPGAFNIAARAMGVTTAQLGKMLEQGQILATDFLPKFAAELTRSLGDAPEQAAQSAQAAMNRMAGAWTQAKQAFADTGPAGGLVWVLDAMANSMRRFADGVADAKNAGWGGVGQFMGGAGYAAIGVAGGTEKSDINPTKTQRADQLVQTIGRLMDERKRLQAETFSAFTSDLEAQRDARLKEIDTEEQTARQELDRVSRRGKIRIDLARDFAEQEAQAVRRRNDLVKQADAELATYDDNIEKQQKLDALKKKYVELKDADPARYQRLMAAAREKLFGKQTAAERLEDLDAEQRVERQRLKAHLDDLSAQQKAGQISQLDEIRQGAGLRLAELDTEIALEEKKKVAAGRDRTERARARGRIAELEVEQATVTRQAANDEIELRRAQTLALDQWARSEGDALEQLRFEASLIGKSREEQQALTNARRIDLAVRNATRNGDGSLKVEADVETGYQAAAEAAKDAYRERLAERKRYEEDWVEGSKRALADYLDATGRVAEQSGRLFETAARGAEDMWVKFFTTGKLQVRDWGAAIMEEIGRIYYQRNIAKPMASVIDAGVSALGAFLGLGGASGGVQTWEAAKGARFDGSVAAFSRGGVVNRPTPFRFANGGTMHNGLMGEAGPEAIMPLRRDASGNLGVMAGAGGGGVNITIINEAGNVATASVGNVQQNAGGALDVELLVTRAVTGDARRNGPMTQALAQTFGLSRRAV